MDKKSKVLEFIKEHKAEILTVGGVLLAGTVIGVLCRKSSIAANLGKTVSEACRDIVIPDELKGMINADGCVIADSCVQILTEVIPIGKVGELLEKLKQIPEIDGAGDVQLIMYFNRAK